MNWLYRQLWRRVGGRPWTYIIRDFAYRNPLFMLLIGANIGFYIGSYFIGDFVHLSWFFGGVLCGHLFWGTKWREGQKQ